MNTKRGQRQNPSDTVKETIEFLLKAGADSASRILPTKIVVDERVRLKCRVPLCNSYNRNLMCPPALPAVAETREIVMAYSHAILVRVSFGGARDKRAIFQKARLLHELINDAEKFAFFKGRHLAAGFIGGCCRLCKECVGPASGKQCRHPLKARPSMEAMGIDVAATLRKIGETPPFSRDAEPCWTGLLLL